MPDAKWAGAVDVGVGWAVYRGPVGDAETHQHLALQFTVLIDGSLDVELNGKLQHDAQALLVAKNTPHLLLGAKAEIISLYADPITTLGQRLNSVCGGETGLTWRSTPLDAQGFGAAVTQAEGLGWSSGFRQLIDDWLGPVPHTPPNPDPRLLQATEIIGADLSGTHRLGTVADQVGLSPGRLSVLFRRDLGIAFRAYVRWARVVAASNAIAGGANATEAAHLAGFADQAHFTRSFRDLFGTPPASGLLSNQFISV